MKKLFSTLLLACTLAVTGVGCGGKLASAGPYQGDQALFTADQTIVGAYDLFHAFVSWEYLHRPALAEFPEIKQAADNVRANARIWIASAIALRDAYQLNPGEAERDALLTALAVLRAALLESTRHLNAHAN